VVKMNNNVSNTQRFQTEVESSTDDVSDLVDNLDGIQDALENTETPEVAENQDYEWDQAQIGEESQNWEDYSEEKTDRLDTVIEDRNALQRVLNPDKGSLEDAIVDESIKLGKRVDTEEDAVAEAYDVARTALDDTNLPELATNVEMLDFLKRHKSSLLDRLDEYNSEIEQTVAEMDSVVERVGEIRMRDAYDRARRDVKTHLADTANVGDAYEAIEAVIGDVEDTVPPLYEVLDEQMNDIEESSIERAERTEEAYTAIVNMAETYADMVETVEEYADEADYTIKSDQFLDEMVTKLSRARTHLEGDEVNRYDTLNQNLEAMSGGAYDTVSEKEAYDDAVDELISASGQERVEAA